MGDKRAGPVVAYFTTLMELTDEWRDQGIAMEPSFRGMVNLRRLQKGFRVFQKLEPELYQEWIAEGERFQGSKSEQEQREFVRSASLGLWDPPPSVDPQFHLASFDCSLRYLVRVAAKHGIDLGSIELRVGHDDYPGLEYTPNPQGGYSARIRPPAQKP